MKKITILNRTDIIDLYGESFNDDHCGVFNINRLPETDISFIFEDEDVEQMLDNDEDLSVDNYDGGETSEFIKFKEVFRNFTSKHYIPKEFFIIEDAKKPLNKKTLLKNIAIGAGVVFMPGGFIVGGYLAYKKLRG